jgi:phycocyanin-associated rod protein
LLQKISAKSVFNSQNLGNMLGQTASDNRVFVYEVSGLRQNTENDKNDYPFRTSSSVFMKVPYQRMNEEMKRITRMGGTIVNIKLWTGETEPNHNAENAE